MKSYGLTLIRVPTICQENDWNKQEIKIKTSSHHKTKRSSIFYDFMMLSFRPESLTTWSMPKQLLLILS